MNRKAKIREILYDPNLQCEMMADLLDSLFEEEMKEIIGEDDVKDELEMMGVIWYQRNKLRREQRGKLDERI